MALYVALYALLRLGLEELRLHPPLVLGLSWYQVLALALLLLAGGVFAVRSRQPSLRASACSS